MSHDISVVGIDLAKQIFHLAGADARDQIILRKRLARGEVLSFIANLTQVTAGMETCGGTHEWARQRRKQGHDVKQGIYRLRKQLPRILEDAGNELTMSVRDLTPSLSTALKALDGRILITKHEVRAFACRAKMSSFIHHRLRLRKGAI